MPKSTSNVMHPNSNVVMGYKLTASMCGAELRCSKLTDSYSVNSEESQAKTTKAFYPHRRSQGSFAMVFDFNGYDEYTEAMTWFRSYAQALLTAQSPSAILIQMESRNFVRAAIPTSGITFGDHIGSNVFSPTITFMSVSDPNDAYAKLVKSSSFTAEGADQLSTKWFYPDSVMNQPGKLENALYDQNLATATPITPGGTGGPARAN